MPIILKNTPVGRRAAYITKVDAEALVSAGDATQCPGYPDMFEEVDPSERAQGYMTRSMQAVAPVKRGPGRPPKQRPVEEVPTDGKDQ
jgi:hypothetical protein